MRLRYTHMPTQRSIYVDDGYESGSGMIPPPEIIYWDGVGHVMFAYTGEVYDDE